MANKIKFINLLKTLPKEVKNIGVVISSFGTATILIYLLIKVGSGPVIATFIVTEAWSIFWYRYSWRQSSCQENDDTKNGI